MSSNIAGFGNYSFRISVIIAYFAMRLAHAWIRQLLISHSAWPWLWQEKEKQETVYQKECIYTAVCTAIALQSIHLFQSLLQQHCILFSCHQTIIQIVVILHTSLAIHIIINTRRHQDNHPRRHHDNEHSLRCPTSCPCSPRCRQQGHPGQKGQSG